MRRRIKLALVLSAIMSGAASSLAAKSVHATVRRACDNTSCHGAHACVFNEITYCLLRLDPAECVVFDCVLS